MPDVLGRVDAEDSIGSVSEWLGTIRLRPVHRSVEDRNLSNFKRWRYLVGKGSWSYALRFYFTSISWIRALRSRSLRKFPK